MPKSKAMCSGCYQDFYNGRQNCDGNNECWHFGKAKVVTRMRVGTWQNPPYVWSPRKTLTCYSPQGSSMISRDDPRVITAKQAESLVKCEREMRNE